ncbi:hypothetical protein BDF20DRAFT_684691 [Mycotypha africana]|uniref:uncharacterized protein n=1 Tax=Mycotypha africana TaxID=64632 RepID=UPI0023009790|nr:uncharacterized protein BDF20DRAFT_684691 [Mycotypha africana]KAI8971531.1 hypothetical protein BDF20DRAFT_684691 [Mycotypha africana]
MQLSQTMMGMFDEIYKANIKIGSSFKPAGNGKVIMSLMINNRTRLPMLDLKGKIQIETDEVIIQYKEALDQLNQAIPNIFESDEKCDFMPHQQYIQKIEITLNELTQCNGQVQLNFLNPLNSKPIEIHQPFGIYLIDQLNKLINTQKDDNDDAVETALDTIWYSTAFIREIMAIHPAKGIEKNTTIILESHTQAQQHKIYCKISDISTDLNKVQIQFYSEDEQLTMNLIKELNILQK